MSMWHSLLETAIHAPSPHNVQPWRVRVLNDTEADLFIDSHRTLPKEDPTGSFIILTRIAELPGPQSHFPILFVFGRADLTVPFYGAKIFPTDIEDIINAHPTLVRQLNSFQLSSYEDENIDRRLKIHLETVKGFAGELPPAHALLDIFFDGLCACNQDFREVTKMFDRSCIEIEVHPFETGPFAGRDIRIKNRYIAPQ
jgi:phenylacetate-CoA ligase